MIRLAAALAGLLIFTAACSSSSLLEVEGILTDVQGDLTTVESFTVIDLDGVVYTFLAADDLTFHGGPLSHIRDHLLNGQPIRVGYEEQSDGTLLAIEVSDAGS